MPKSNYEKIVALFEGEELGPKILLVDALREKLEKDLEDKDKELDAEKERFAQIKQSIKKQ